MPLKVLVTLPDHSPHSCCCHFCGNAVTAIHIAIHVHTELHKPIIGRVSRVHWVTMWRHCDRCNQIIKMSVCESVSVCFAFRIQRFSVSLRWTNLFRAANFACSYSCWPRVSYGHEQDFSNANQLSSSLSSYEWFAIKFMRRFLVCILSISILFAFFWFWI